MNTLTISRNRFHVSGEGFAIENASIGIDFADKPRSLSPTWELLSQEQHAAEDPCGKLQGYKMRFSAPEGLEVEWIGGLYEGGEVFSCRMCVINRGATDVRIQALVPLCARGTEGGSVHAEGVHCAHSVMLSNGKWMASSHELTIPLDPRLTSESYHVSAFLDAQTNRALAFGMGERTNTIVRIEAALQRQAFDLSIAGLLEVDLAGNPLRLAPGREFEMNRVIVLSAGDTFATLDRYGSFLAKYMGIEREGLRPASGIFCVYGQERADTDNWEKIALTDRRMEEFMDVADRFLKPYGLTYLKSQFGGASSGPSDAQGLNVFYRRDWTKQPVWPVPGEDETMDKLIERAGFTPDTCDISHYHPDGVAAMCARVHERGYKNALVCRPYLNVMAGSDERDRICVDIFRMAVERWGYDYLMFDFNDADFETDRDDETIAQSMMRRFSEVRRAVGSRVYIEACMIMPGCVMGLADSYRPASDWRGGTEEQLVGPLSSMYFLHGKVFQLDSEFFDPDITPFVWGNEKKPYCRHRFLGSLARVRSWTSWCALTGYNLFTGGVIDEVGDERWHIFTRALPIYGKCAVPLDIAQTQSPVQWYLEAENAAGTYCVIGLFNWDSLRQKETVLDFSALGLDDREKYIAFDFWGEKVFEVCNGMRIRLLPSDCMVLVLHKCTGKPMYVGSNRHVTDAFGLAEWSYNEETMEIVGQSEGPGDTEITHYLYLPNNNGPATAENCMFEVPQPGVVRVAVRLDSSGERRWRLVLDPNKRTI